MEHPNYMGARDRAQQVLQENFVVSPPVRVGEIAKNYGLDITEVELGEDFSHVSGFIDPEERVIYVNRSDSDTRKAFTIAHELGHWLLHQDQLKTDPDRYAIVYRIPIGRLNIDPVEKEANVFAANLLVPREWLDKHTDKNPEEIARIFGVSPEVIGYRLQEHEPNRPQ